MRTPVVERFWSKIRVLGPDDCWMWLNARKGLPGKQYGNFHCGVDGIRYIGAHRFAWIIANGPIPDGLWVLHRCDVMLCVNVNHLFLGTVIDNNIDMKTKDRVRFGEGHWAAKLAEDDIRSIVARVAAGESQRYAGTTYGINQSTVSKIVAGESWRRALRSFDPRRELDDLCDYRRWLLGQADVDPYLAKALRGAA